MATNNAMGAAAPAVRRAGLGRVRRGLVVACAFVGGAIIGTGGLAMAAGGGPWQGPWAHGHRLERMQARVHRALDAVGATSAQETKIHDIIAQTFSGMEQDRDGHAQRRQQMIALLSAPTIDRAAVEKLRADGVAAFDARSKAVTGALLDAADQLDPAQRAKLAERMSAMMEHHRGMDGGRWRGHHEDGNGDHGPGEGPESGPDKG